jgi:hypothetical protein
VSDRRAQSFATHARYVPGYHFILSFILLVNLGYAVIHAWRFAGTFQAPVYLLLSIGLVLMYWYTRLFAVTVQDRVIRLEETLRMERLLPPDLKGRIGELTRGQFVALRFASDAELPALVRKVLDERIVDQKAIKALVKDWRPDHLRA